MLYAMGGKVVDHRCARGRAYAAFAVFFLAFAIYHNTPYGAWLARLG